MCIALLIRRKKQSSIYFERYALIQCKCVHSRFVGQKRGVFHNYDKSSYNDNNNYNNGDDNDNNNSNYNENNNNNINDKNNNFTFRGSE